MNTTSLDPPMSGPHCAQFASLLPLVRAGELDADQAAAVHAHTATCPWCQRELAAYDTIDAGLRRCIASAAAPMHSFSLDDILRLADRHAPIRIHRKLPRARPIEHSRGPRRLLLDLAPIAAVLVIVALALTTFSLRSARVGQPLGTPAPSPTPDLAHLDLYVLSDGGLAALRASDGKLRWQNSASSWASWSCQPLGEGAVVCVPPVDGPGDTRHSPLLGVALRMSDGSLLWQAPLPENAPPYGEIGMVVADGVVYLSTFRDANHDDGIAPDGYAVYALRASDGGLLWRYQAPQRIVSPPAVADGMVYVGVGSTITALRALDGAVLWRSPLTAQGRTSDRDPFQGWRLTAVNGVLYVNAIDYLPNSAPEEYRCTFALRARDGADLWHFRSAYNGEVFAPVVLGSMVYVSTGGYDALDKESQLPTAHIYALRVSDGSLVWDDHDSSTLTLEITNKMGARASVEFEASVGELAVAPGVIYATDGFGHVEALRPSDGTVLWRHLLPVNPDGTPATVSSSNILAVADGIVFFGGRGGVIALAAADGAQIWQQSGYQDVYGMGVVPVRPPATGYLPAVLRA